MKIIRLSSETGFAYRVCIVRRNSAGQLEARSLFKPRNGYEWVPLKEGSVLTGTFYAGTKPKFPLSYYSGVDDLSEGESEVLLTLNVPKNLLPEQDAFMGSELVVTNPIVQKIELVEDALANPEYDA